MVLEINSLNLTEVLVLLFVGCEYLIKVFYHFFFILFYMHKIIIKFIWCLNVAFIRQSYHNSQHNCFLFFLNQNQKDDVIHNHLIETHLSRALKLITKYQSGWRDYYNNNNFVLRWKMLMLFA